MSFIPAKATVEKVKDGPHGIQVREPGQANTILAKNATGRKLVPGQIVLLHMHSDKGGARFAITNGTIPYITSILEGEID